MKINTRIAALLLAAPVALGVVVGCDDRPPRQEAPVVEEVEDCDAEDLLNLEDDCGFSGSTTTTTKKKAKTTTTKKTTSKKTR